MQEYTSPLASTIDYLTNHETTDRIPSLTGTAANSRTPTNSNIMKVFYQFETTQGPWTEATITSGGGTSSVDWSASALDTLTIGFNSLYVVALDSTSGTINMTENFTGSITPYYFLVRVAGAGIEGDLLDSDRLMLFSDNLFINSAVLTYRIPRGEDKGRVILRVYNIYGGLVKELVNRECSPGIYTARWDGTNLYGVMVPSGVYFYNLKTDTGELSRKGLVIR